MEPRCCTARGSYDGLPVILSETEADLLDQPAFYYKAEEGCVTFVISHRHLSDR